MKVLVAVASRHGATKKIAEAVADRLRQVLVDQSPDGAAAIEVDLREPEAVTDLAAYDAAVIGSAVYAGRWRKPLRHFVAGNAATLRAIPVWLFSSGPVGDPLGPDTLPVDVAEMSELTGAVEHRIFAGEIDRSTLNMAERAIVSALGVAEGDYRDWDRVREWADEIATRLLGAPVPSRTSGIAQDHPSPGDRREGGQP